MADEKHCPRCDEDWPADTGFFYADASSSDGLFYCCKACHTANRDSKRQNLGVPQGARITDELAQLRWMGVGQ